MLLTAPADDAINSAAIYINHPKTYTEPILGLKQFVNVRLVSFAGAARADDGSSVVWHVGASDLSSADIQAYIDFQNVILSCANHAERINADFLHINKHILGKSFEKAEDGTPADSSFMTLKSNIVSYVKKDPETKALLSPSLRTSLENFVHYRNIFTHGQVRMLCTAPDGFVNSTAQAKQDGRHHITVLPGRVDTSSWYISSEPKPNKKICIPVDKKLLDNYLSVYEEACVFINKFSTIKKGEDN